MCNAWNHRPGCACGWGGEGHLGGGGHGWNAEATWEGGYDVTNPNAHCPICGDPVFFLKPRSGGCVWLEAMGPPWPKHPCMASTARQESYPAPTSVPAFSIREWHRDGWDTNYLEFDPYFDRESGCWAIRVGWERCLIARQPPDQLSPAYFTQGGDWQPYGVIEYLSSENGKVVTTRLHTLVELKRRMARLRRIGIPATAPEDDWATLKWFIREGFNLNERVAQKLLSLIERDVGWLLDPNWQSSNAGPTLVRARVKLVCEEFPEVDSNCIYRWMKILL